MTFQRFECGCIGCNPPYEDDDMPQLTREEIIVDAFWNAEARVGYERALEMTAERFMSTVAEVQKMVAEADALDNGNQ